MDLTRLSSPSNQKEGVQDAVLSKTTMALSEFQHCCSSTRSSCCVRLLRSRSDFVILLGFAKGMPTASFAHGHAKSEPSVILSMFWTNL
eukprot:s4562_g1.t1